MSTDLSAELRTSTGDQPAFSPLLGNMLVIMSADSTFGKLADTLAQIKKEQMSVLTKLHKMQIQERALNSILMTEKNNYPLH